MNIRNTLLILIKNIHTALDEIYYEGNCAHSEQNTGGTEVIGGHDTVSRHLDDFQLGQAYAYVECLEILQTCEQLRQLGLEYDIESRYPLA